MTNDHGSLPSGDYCRQLRKAARETTSWRHRSATGALLRACVLPELSAASRALRRPITLQIELLNAGNDTACRDFGRHIGLDVDAARRRLQIETYATIVAVCLERKENRRLHAHIRLSPLFTRQQVDLTDDRLILTPSGHAEQAAMTRFREQYRQSFQRELGDAWERAKHTDLKLQAVDWSPVGDGEQIRGYHIINLLRELHLPVPEFTDGELKAIVERLDGHEPHGGDLFRGVDAP
ncbi:MAG TPA: hypothetical protein VFN97_27540 [Actinospica sp.]|nr:hypothetical protein [Actinospica sp.]